MQKYLSTAMFIGALVFAPLVSTSANAATAIFNVAGIESYEDFLSPANSVFTVDIGAGSEVIGLSWNVNITAFSPSWLSEAVVALTDSAVTEGVFFTPGIGIDNAGTADFSGSSDYVALGLNFFVGADGLLRLEFWENFDDGSVAPDALWNSGTLTVNFTPGAAVVPEPTTWAMLIAGFGLVGFAARRRRIGLAQA